MRIAVVSTDKKRVNERFGRAERFLIYEEKANGLILIDERMSEPLFDSFDGDMLDWVADIIHDCERVYMARICDHPARLLSCRGIMPVEYEGLILEINLADEQEAIEHKTVSPKLMLDQ